jgi:S-(hydroxymethyl)glutathione dehydrogenase/alcohol dehydrogenase
MRATAAVLYEIKTPLVIEEVELLDPAAHEVLVRWAANGVCHSDLHVVTGDYPHPLPVVLGHEAAGIVEKVGAGVDSVKPAIMSVPVTFHRAAAARTASVGSRRCVPCATSRAG